MKPASNPKELEIFHKKVISLAKKHYFYHYDNQFILPFIHKYYKKEIAQDDDVASLITGIDPNGICRHNWRKPTMHPSM